MWVDPLFLMLCRATQSPLSLHILVVVASGSRLTLDFHFIDFFWVFYKNTFWANFYFFCVFSEPYLREDPAIDCMNSPLTREFRSHLSSKYFSVECCSDEVRIVNKFIMITINTLNSVDRRMQILSANFKVLFQQVFNCCAGSSSFNRFQINTWFSIYWFFWCVTSTHSEPILIFLVCFQNLTWEKTWLYTVWAAPSPGNSGSTSRLDIFQFSVVQIRSILSTSQVHHDHHKYFEFCG